VQFGSCRTGNESAPCAKRPITVMPGLDPGIHGFDAGMTIGEVLGRAITLSPCVTPFRATNASARIAYLEASLSKPMPIRPPMPIM